MLFKPNDRNKKNELIYSSWAEKQYNMEEEDDDDWEMSKEGAYQIGGAGWTNLRVNGSIQ